MNILSYITFICIDGFISIFWMWKYRIKVGRIYETPVLLTYNSKTMMVKRAWNISLDSFIHISFDLSPILLGENTIAQIMHSCLNGLLNFWYLKIG